MDIFHKLLLFIAAGIYSISTLNAQYIITDKDGYTNVHEEPSSKSEIVERVVKYQVFYSAEDIPCYDLDDTPNKVGNWLRISTDLMEPTGYIYTKNIYSLDKLPVLCAEKWIEDNSFTCSNDSISVTITFQPFNERNKIEGRMYGTDGWTPHKEIKEIRVSHNGKEVNLPENKFKSYYDIGYVSVWVGFDGELYINFSGGDGSGGYGVILTILNGDIINSIVFEC